MQMRRRFARVAEVVPFVLVLASLATAEDFAIQERLGRAWTREVVTLDPSAEEVAAAKEQRALCDAQGRAYLYQLLDEKQLAVLLDLAPDQRLVLDFREAKSRPVPKSDLKVDETGDAIRLSNDRMAIAIRKRLTGPEGPIQAVRLPDASWASGSTLGLPAGELAYQASVIHRGPVLAEVLCTLTGSGGGRWQWRFRLQTGEPVVTVDEDFRTFGRADMTLEMARGLEPDTVLYRFGKSDEGRQVGFVAATPLAEIPGDTKFVLEPWIHWWERTTQGNWLGLYRGDGGPLLVAGAYRPSVWVDPAQPPRARQFAQAPLVAGADGALELRFEGENARRQWFIGVLDAGQVLGSLGEGQERYQAPPPQQYLVKHGHFPLDHVNRMVLAWPPKKRKHPRLFIDEATLEAFRQRYVPQEDELARVLRQPIRMYEFDDIFYHWLGSRHPDLEVKLVEAALELTDQMARRIYQQDDLVYYGFAPHHQNAIRCCAMIADLILDSPRLTEEQRQSLLGKLAFIACAVATDDYWSPERGFSANPNMTTFAASYQAVLGALLRDHPKSDDWLGAGMGELTRQIEQWSGPNGGWLEAPHYCMASYDPLVAYFWMAHLAGYNDLVFSERSKKVALWFAKIATPPDARIKGWRHNPPIGNTYKFEPCGQYGLLAALWRENDPELAAHMQWMHEQQGAFATPGVGGFFAAFAGYRRIYTAGVHVPAKAPSWGSELFPKAGAVLRAHFPSQRETMLYLIAGPFHDHYDKDSGSFTLWGKGRVIADDFGYQGYMPAADHSMLESDLAPEGQVMNVTHFQTSTGLDYVAAEKGAWRRQIALVKDSDPLGANFVVINDTLGQPAEATWRLWLTADQVLVKGSGADVTGKEDVDTTIRFLRLPQGATIGTAELTRQTWGLDGNAKYGRTSSTQTGLIVSWEQGQTVTTVIYPRLRGEEPPAVTAVADGAGVKIESAGGTDYVFLSRDPVEIEADGVAFRGTAGAIQIRGDQPPKLALGASGELSFERHTLQQGPTSRSER